MPAFEAVISADSIHARAGHYSKDKAKWSATGYENALRAGNEPIQQGKTGRKTGAKPGGIGVPVEHGLE